MADERIPITRPVFDDEEERSIQEVEASFV